MPKQKKKQKQFKPSMIPVAVMIIMVILTGSFLVVGGLYVWYYTTVAGPIQHLAEGQKVLQQEIVKLQNGEAVVEEEEEIQKEEEVEEKEVEDWTIFKIESENFEFKYPRDWYLDDNTEQLRENYYGNLFILTKSQSGLLPENGIKIDFNVDKSSDLKSLDDLLPCSISGFEKELIYCKEQTIGGKKYKVKSTVYNDGTKTIEMVVINGGDIYRTIGFATKGNEQDENFEMIQEIFDTYRFE